MAILNSNRFLTLGVKQARHGVTRLKATPTKAVDLRPEPASAHNLKPRPAGVVEVP